MAEIAYEHVSKIYPDGTQAVHDLELEIRDAELMVLVGPSGCGKTTALRMLAGLEEISEGEIRIGDRIVNDLTPKDRDIAMVFQSYALYPHMTVAQNLAFGLKLRKLPKKEVDERVQRAARILQIEEFLKRKPRALSGGQRQRVAMGRAIVREPQAFLMDEPLSNLDAKLRVQMRAEIHQLQRRLGVTTIYVTHDQVEAMTMGDRVAVMNAGHLQQVDTPQVLYDQPGQRVRRRLHRLAVDQSGRVGARPEQRQPPGHPRRAQADRRRPARPQPLGPRRLRRQEDHPRDQAGGLRGRRPSSRMRPPTAGSRSRPTSRSRSAPRCWSTSARRRPPSSRAPPPRTPARMPTSVSARTKTSRRA